MSYPASMPHGSQSYDIAALNPSYVDQGAARPGSSLPFPGYAQPQTQNQPNGQPRLAQQNGAPPQGDPAASYASLGGFAPSVSPYSQGPQTPDPQAQLALQQASMMAQRQQLFQQQQSQNAGGGGGGGGFGGQQPPQAQYAQPGYGQQPNSSHAPPSQSNPSYSLPRTQDWASIVAGLTPEKFNALPENQQAALREFIMRQKMGQQSQLGHGHPGSPAGSAGASPAPSGSPAPPPGGYRPTSGQQQPGPPQGPSAQSQAFMKALGDFHRRKGIPFNGPALVEGKMLDMSRLYTLMIQGGGYMKVQADPSRWRNILNQMGFAPDVAGNHPDSRVNAISQAYHGTIYPFEQAFSHAQLLRQQQQQQQQLALQNAARANGTAPPPSTSTNSPYQNAAQQLPQGMQPSQLQRSFGLQQPPMGGLPFASAQLGQPGMRVGTPTQALQLPGSGLDSEDRKGKGKAMEGMPIDKDVVDLAALSMPPLSSSYPSSVLATSTSILTPRPGSSGTPKPPATNGLDASVGKRPDAPTGPPRRKRQRVEYVPLQRTVDTYASWDLGQVEDVVVAASQRKRPRTVHDLGSLDIHSLTMSLKSRLGSEVAYALNALTLISLTVRQSASDQQGLAFPLAACGELFDELLDLLEETAFGALDESDDEAEAGEPAAPATPPPLRSYRELFRIVTQEELELAELPPATKKNSAALADAGLCPLEPIETITALMNLLRNFSLSDENIRTFSAKRKVLHVLVRIADLPLRRDGAPRGRWPVQVTAAQSVALKKDAIETITHFALDVRLDAHTDATAKALFRLVLFFILDADHTDQLYFDLSGSPSSSSRIPQAPPSPLAHYLTVGLSAFARITTPDVNRFVFAELTPVDLYALFESLVHLLPVTESDFHLVTSEAGLYFAETLATTLYNIVFLAPAELKLRLRVVPSFIKAFLRVVKRLYGTTQDAGENPFVILCEHCVATLTLLSEVGGISAVGSQTSGGGLWFGLGPLADEDDRPSGLHPTDLDRGTVTAKQPPKSGRHKAPAVLSGDPRQVFALLATGMPTPFLKLSGLLDASSGKAE